MPRNLEEMFACRDLRNSPLMVVQTVMAARISILYARAGRDYLPGMAVRLRSVRAAKALESALSTINRIWPQSFLARRPCCPAMSPDEALIADVTLAAMRGRRADAIDAMRDLLPCLARDRLFNDLVEFVDALRAVETDPADAGTAQD